MPLPAAFFFFASYITVFPHVLTVVVHGLYLHLFPPAVPRDQYPLWSALTAAFSLQFVQLTNINPLHSTHFFFFHQPENFFLSFTSEEEFVC